MAEPSSLETPRFMHVANALSKSYGTMTGPSFWKDESAIVRIRPNPGTNAPHANLRLLARNYGNLLESEMSVPPPGPPISSDALRKICRGYSRASCPEITLYFKNMRKGKSTPIIPVSLDNIELVPHAPEYGKVSLAQLLYILGEASIAIKEGYSSLRGQEIEPVIGTIQYIPDALKKAYGHILHGLKEKGFDETEAVKMIDEAGLDMDKYLTEALLRHIEHGNQVSLR